MHENDPLFQPLQIGKRRSPNRFAINAMECCDAEENGNPGPKTYRRYESHMEGGCGFIVGEAITIGYESRSRKMQLSIMPHNQDALTKFTSRIKAINPDALFVWQLTHSGEISHPDFSQRVTPKPLPGFTDARLLEAEDVDKIADDFVLAAKIAHDSGADGIDFKQCHGYLGSQLLRPYNDRKWKYGGSWENRSRFAFETYERIMKEINDPEFIVGSKVSMWEAFPGGQGTQGPESPIMDLTESIRLIKGLEDRGASFIICSVGSPSITLAKSQPDKAIPDDVYLHFTFQKAAREALKPETAVIGSGYSVLNKGKNRLQARKEEESTPLLGEQKCL